MTKLPQARTAEIVVQDLKGELLVYNLTTHQAFTLNETLKVVYQSCDGQTSFDELKRKYRFTDDLIFFALAELQANDLLEGYENKHFKGLSRREAIRRVGVASMVALPVISGLVAPRAAMAASNAGTLYSTCATSQDCGSAAPNCNSITEGDQSGSRRCCATTSGHGTGGARVGYTVAAADGCSACRSGLNGKCCSGAVSDFNCPPGNVQSIFCGGYCT